MPNKGVSGSVVNSLGQGIEQLLVEVVDKDALFGDDRLGEVSTQAGGKFSVAYPPGKYGLEANPDLQVKIYSPYRRLICQTGVYEDFSNDVLDLGVITIPANDEQGWLSTCRSESELTIVIPTRTIPMKLPPLVSVGNVLTPVIDNVDAWERLTVEVRNAQKSINLAQFYFDVGAVYTEFPPEAEMSGPHDPPPYTRLENELVGRNINHVDVRILIRDAHFSISEDLSRSFESLNIGQLLLLILVATLLGPLTVVFFSSGGGLPYPIDTAGIVAKFFREAAVAVREFRCAMTQPMHAKFAIFDGKLGFFCTSPLTQDYYNSSAHLIGDPRRGSNKHQAYGVLGCLSRSGGTAKHPVHDVSLLLSGPVIMAMDKFFYQLWNNSGTPDQIPADGVYPGPIDSSNTSTVQLVRTISPNRLTGVVEGERGILEAYLRAIEKAEKFIYIENQYYTEAAINEAIIERVKRNVDLVVLILLNSNPDTPGYIRAQNNLLPKLLADGQGRVRVFTLWKFEAESSQVLPIYIHSKVAIVDDIWATIGSANLDEAGMRQSMELNVVMGSAIGGGPANTVAADLRRKLWSEHLGAATEFDPALDVTGPAMLKLWDDRAKILLNNLNGTAAPGSSALPRELKYIFEHDAKRYLTSFGIINPALKILDGVRGFSFEKGTWL